MKKFISLSVDRSQTKKIFLFLVMIVLVLLFIFYCSKKNSKVLKIGFITDWEYQQNNDNEKNATKSFLAKAVSHYNYLSKPDLAIGGGDYLKEIETKNSTQLQAIISIFEKIRTKKLYCLGKNDYAAHIRRYLID